MSYEYNDGVTAGKDEVNNFLSNIQGSNRQSNQRAAKSGFEILAAMIAAAWLRRKKTP